MNQNASNSSARTHLGRGGQKRPPPPEQKPKAPVLGYLALAFFACVAPYFLYQNSAAQVLPASLEARCKAAYQDSTYRQFKSAGYTFGYPQRFNEKYGASRTRMSVVNMDNPGLQWSARPSVKLLCRLDALHRVHLSAD